MASLSVKNNDDSDDNNDNDNNSHNIKSKNTVSLWKMHLYCKKCKNIQVIHFQKNSFNFKK